jgi:hypothetical protein
MNLLLAAALAMACQLTTPAPTPHWTVMADAQVPPVAQVVTYSHGYQVRARVHRVSSTAMLPLFATQVWLGQSLPDDPASNRRTAHIAVGSAIGGLFAVNTATGVWNLIEARRDPYRRKQRMFHGTLMLAADGAFLASAMLAPSEGNETGSRSAHRAVSLTAVAVATAGYLVMLLGGR